MYLRLIIFGLLLGMVGCGARSEVAKEHVLYQVDKLLGEVDVNKKEAEIAVRKIEVGLDELKRGKLEAKVRLSQATERLSELTDKMVQVDQALVRLREPLKGNQEAHIDGKPFSVAAVKDMANRCIRARKQLASESEALLASSRRLESIVNSYEQRELDGRERLQKIKWHLDEVDASSLALKSMQDAVGLSGTNESVDFAAVEKQVRELKAKIDTELAFQDEKWQESGLERSLDAILRETSTASDTLAEIDAILGLK